MPSGLMREVCSIRWEREAIPQVGHLPISGSHIAELPLLVWSHCWDEMAKLSKDLRITLNVGVMGKLNQCHFDIVMAVSPCIKWQPGTHDAVFKPVYCAAFSPNWLSQAILTLW